MTTIAIRCICRPRKLHRCIMCGESLTGSHIDAYGYAKPGDRPFHARLCIPCHLYHGPTLDRKKVQP